MGEIFNLLRYKELVQLDKSENFALLDPLSLELLNYRANIEDQMLYNHKKEFFQLIDMYLSQIITPCDFRDKFCEIWNKSIDKANILILDPQKLEGLMLADNRENFGDVIGEIYELCYHHHDDFFFKLSDYEFYNWITKGYLILKKVFPVFWTNSLVYENLIFCSFKTLISSLGICTLIIGFEKILLISNNIFNRN